MKLKITKLQILAWALSFLPLIAVAAVYRVLPAQIPMHWGFDGAVEYSAKYQLWLVAGMAPLFGALFFVLPLIDPKGRSYDKFRGSYDLFQIIMMLFLLVVTGVVITESLRPGTVNVATLVCALCGILYIALGNMMPKFRQNFFCGFRTPWALSSEAVWTRTQRLGGQLMFAAGFVALAGAFLPGDMWRMLALFVPLAVAVLLPGVMSYIWYRREQERQEEP